MSNELIESRPSFLAPTVDNEAELRAVMAEMSKELKPPFVKVIQAMTGEPYKPPFREGDIIVPPFNVKIGDNDTPFSFTPIFYFKTFLCFNPIQLKASMPALREFSFDTNSPLARKCGAFIKEKCPENPQYELKFNQVINFFVIIHGVDELKDTPVTLSFKGGEYKTGQNLINMITVRKAFPYGCRFRSASEIHKSKQGFQPQGLNIQNDPVAWITDEVAYNK